MSLRLSTKLNILSIYIIILSFIIIEQSFVNCQFKCIHDSIKHKTKKRKGSSPKSQRQTAITTPRKMEILYDLSELKAYEGTKSDTYITYIETSIKESIKVLSNIISMPKNLESYKNIAADLDVCNVAHYEEKYTKTTSFDLLIYPVFSSDMQEGAVAVSTVCVTFEDDSRPIVGSLIINSNFNYTTTKQESFSTIVLHELIHILGFSTDYFTGNQRVIKRTVNGVQKPFLGGPKLISAASHHFNCTDFYGVELEDDNGMV